MHEYAPDEIDERIGNVSAISPGVLGNTGLETGEVVEGVVSLLKPAPRYRGGFAGLTQHRARAHHAAGG